MDCLYIKKNIKGKKKKDPSLGFKFDGAWNNVNEVFYGEEGDNSIPNIPNIEEPVEEQHVAVGDGLLAQLEAQADPRREQPLTWQDVRDILDRYANALEANQYAWYQI